MPLVSALSLLRRVASICPHDLTLIRKRQRPNPARTIMRGSRPENTNKSTFTIYPALAAARSVRIRVGVLRSQADSWALALSGMSGTGLVQRQLLGNGCEKLSDVLGCLCRRLEEKQTGFLGICLSVGSGNRSLIGLLSDQVEFVTGQSNDDVLVCLALELLDPSLGLI